MPMASGWKKRPVLVHVDVAMLLGDRRGLTPHDLDRYADAGVETFLRAHGTPDLGERDDLRL